MDRLRDDNDYWESCWNFYQDVKTRSVDELTEKQKNWLMKIEDKLEELS
jgi:hypothetical protein